MEGATVRAGVLIDAVGFADDDPAVCGMRTREVAQGLGHREPVGVAVVVRLSAGDARGQPGCPAAERAEPATVPEPDLDAAAEDEGDETEGDGDAGVRGDRADQVGDGVVCEEGGQARVLGLSDDERGEAPHRPS